MRALEIIELIKNEGYQPYKVQHRDGVYLKRNIFNKNIIIEINRDDIKIGTDTIKIRVITEYRSLEENLIHLEATIKFIEGIE